MPRGQLYYTWHRLASIQIRHLETFWQKQMSEQIFVLAIVHMPPLCQRSDDIWAAILAALWYVMVFSAPILIYPCPIRFFSFAKGKSASIWPGSTQPPKVLSQKIVKPPSSEDRSRLCSLSHPPSAVTGLRAGERRRRGGGLLIPGVARSRQGPYHTAATLPVPLRHPSNPYPPIVIWAVTLGDQAKKSEDSGLSLEPLLPGWLLGDLGVNCYFQWILDWLPVMSVSWELLKRVGRGMTRTLGWTTRITSDCEIAAVPTHLQNQAFDNNVGKLFILQSLICFKNEFSTGAMAFGMSWLSEASPPDVSEPTYRAEWGTNRISEGVSGLMGRPRYSWGHPARGLRYGVSNHPYPTYLTISDQMLWR